MTPKIVPVLSIAAVHLILAKLVVALTMRLGMFAVDTGRAEALLGRMLVVVTRVLYFPILSLPLYSRQWFPGNWVYVPMALNSLLWGLAIYVFYRIYRKSIADRA
jgi:hypothetical protein